MENSVSIIPSTVTCAVPGALESATFTVGDV